jgi:hypothetical protein
VGALLASRPATPWLLLLVTTWTRFSPLRHFVFVATKWILPLSGAVCLMQRLIAPRDWVCAASAEVAAVASPRRARDARAARASRRSRRKLGDETVIPAISLPVDEDNRRVKLQIS